MAKKIKLGLLGCGTVGTGVLKVLQENYHDIRAKIGNDIEVSKVLVRNLNKKRDFNGDVVFTDNIDDILNDESIDIVVELLGGIHPAREYMLKAMENGKHVVTANKDILAQFGKDMFDAAEKHDVDFMFEASVAGGIPIITPLKQCLTANKITELIGIVNGTTNYMLTKMTEQGMDYDTALARAQAKGYAEADPTADVAGLDAARKAAILSSIAFNTRVSLEDVKVEGITNITPEDITYAKELGYIIKLLAIAKHTEDGIDVRVHPTFIDKDHPLASVRNVFNAIFIHGNAVGDTMFYGKGAGERPTASAVLADIIDVARDMGKDRFGKIRCTCYEEKKLCPPDKVLSGYYIRLLVEDKPGVLGAIATAFGESNVSLYSVIQKRRVGEFSEIVAITHNVNNNQIEDLKVRLNNLDVVHEISNIIRVVMSQEA